MSLGMLGLDIGTASIKAVVFRKGMNRSTSLVCRGCRFPEHFGKEPSKEELGDFIRRFLTRHRLTGLPTIASIPSSWTISRILTFPFSNPKKISKVLPYELEPQIPFSIDDLLLDHQILSTSTQGTRVLVLGIPHDRAQYIVDTLSHAGVDLRALESQSLAMFNTFRWAFPSPKTAPTLLIDVGQFSTTLALVGPHGLAGLRTHLLEKNFLASEIHQEQTGAPPLPNPMEPSREFPFSEKENQDPSKGLDLLIQGMKMTIRVFEEQLGQPIQQGYLFGGCANLKELPDFFQTQLGVPQLRVCPVSVRKHHLSPIFLPAFGLSVKFLVRPHGSTINFHRKMDGGHNAYNSSKRLWKHVAVAASLVAILGLADFFIHSHLKETHYLELKAQLREQFHTLFPNTKLVVSEVQQIQTQVVRNRRLLNYFGGSQQTILTLLAEISQRVGQEKDTEIHSVMVDNTSMQFEATTSSFEAVERIRKTVMEVPWFQEVKVIDARIGTDSNRVNFGLSLNIGAA